MQENAAAVKEMAADLKAQVNKKTDEFRQAAQANEDNFNNQMSKMMGKIQAGLPDLDINLVAGKESCGILTSCYFINREKTLIKKSRVNLTRRFPKFSYGLILPAINWRLRSLRRYKEFFFIF